MPCGIYKIVCSVDSKVYVGRSVDIEKRFREHRTSLRSNRHSNSYLQRAWNLYGEANFVFSLIEECIVEDTPQREAYWQQYYGIGDSEKCYNLLLEDGTGSFRIHEETKRKMSASSKGKPKSDEHRRNVARAVSEYAAIHGGVRKGMPVTEEQRKKISETLKGRPRAPGVTERIQATKAAKRAQGILPKPQPPHSEETRAKIRENSKRMFEEYKKTGHEPKWKSREAIVKANETRRRLRESGEMISPFQDPEVRARANETRKRNRELKRLAELEKKSKKSEGLLCPETDNRLLVSCQVENDVETKNEGSKSLEKVLETPVQD